MNSFTLDRALGRRYFTKEDGKVYLTLPTGQADQIERGLNGFAVFDAVNPGVKDQVFEHGEIIIQGEFL